MHGEPARVLRAREARHAPRLGRVPLPGVPPVHDEPEGAVGLAEGAPRLVGVKLGSGLGLGLGFGLGLGLGLGLALG